MKTWQQWAADTCPASDYEQLIKKLEDTLKFSENRSLKSTEKEQTLMNTNIQLTAEEIAEACADIDGIGNRQTIEDAFERQTPPDIFIKAIARADKWPNCRDEGRHGLQYAYLIEFLICDESKQ